MKSLADQWTRSDALSAPSYGAAAVWKATAPGLFRDAIVRAKSVALTSTTDRSIFFSLCVTDIDGHRPADQEESFQSRQLFAPSKHASTFGLFCA